VTARVAAAKAETEFVVEVAGREVVGKAPKTASWDDFQTFAIGKIEVAKPGNYEVKVRPRDAATWQPMNLAWLKLQKAK